MVAIAPLAGCWITLKEEISNVLLGVLINGKRLSITLPPIWVASVCVVMVGGAQTVADSVAVTGILALSQLPITIET